MLAIDIDRQSSIKDQNRRKKVLDKVLGLAGRGIVIKWNFSPWLVLVYKKKVIYDFAFDCSSPQWNVRNN